MLKAFETEEIIEVVFTYSYKKTYMIDSVVHIVCSCGVTCQTQLLGVSENCTLTNHAFFTMFRVKYMNVDHFSFAPATSRAISSLFLKAELMTAEDVSLIFEEAVNVNETSFPMLVSEEYIYLI